MFKSTIYQTPLLNEVADAFFTNINGDYYLGDASFISTLRALVAPRMGKEDRIGVRYNSTTYTAGHISEHTTKHAVRVLCDNFYAADVGMIYVHSMRSKQQSDNYACLELLKSTFTKVYDGWQRVEKVTVFFQKQFYVLCFINPELKSVALFVDSLDLRRLHYLQCATFAFLPWYFDASKGVSELEMELIESLREKTSEKYESCIAKIAAQYDFRSEKIKRLLAGFELQFEREERDVASSRIKECIRHINNLNEEIANWIKEKQESEIRLLGLELSISNGKEESEIMQYFLCNKKLYLQRVSGTKITFSVKDYVTYFDEEMAKSMISNNDSYFYRAAPGRSYGGSIADESIKKLMTAIFIDQTLKLKACATYRFNISGNVETVGGFTYGSDFNDAVPNPHIQRFNCLGNYSRHINNLLKDRNYIGAIEQCVASCKSLNLGDAPVMHEFMACIHGRSSYSANNRCIELPNGLVVTPEDAIKWLGEQEETVSE